jgi:arylformamidase
VAAGVRLLGIDYLSVEGYRVTGAPAHHALLRAGVFLLEGLDLSIVPPGEYELLCLPLRLTGADGAPARALLRTVP